MVSCSKNLYEILNVSSKASLDEIKSAYKKMVRIYHPDINKEPTAEIQFKLLNNAYDVLSDIEKRKNYDNLLSISKLHQDKKRADKNSIIKEVKITEIEANEGTTRVVNILNTQICPKCMGTKFLNGIKCAFCKGEGEKKELKQIEVEIKKGVKNGELIFVGKVNSSALYDKNLFLKIVIEKAKELYFKGGKIYFNVDIGLYDLILGKEIEINVPNIGLYKLNIPQLSKNGDEIKLNIENGEFYAVINAIFPEKLTCEELKLFEKLKKLNQEKDICGFEE